MFAILSLITLTEARGSSNEVMWVVNWSRHLIYFQEVAHSKIAMTNTGSDSKPDFPLTHCWFYNTHLYVNYFRLFYEHTTLKKKTSYLFKYMNPDSQFSLNCHLWFLQKNQPLGTVWSCTMLPQLQTSYVLISTPDFSPLFSSPLWFFTKPVRILHISASS